MGPKTVILFLNNLIASATGWSRPHTPTLLGPTRVWEIDNALRSMRVMKATLTNTTKAPTKDSSIIIIQFIPISFRLLHVYQIQ